MAGDARSATLSTLNLPTGESSFVPEMINATHSFCRLEDISSTSV